MKKLASNVFLLAFLASVSHAGYLTSKDVAKIKTHWAAYSIAAEVTDLPVEILPAIHHRESNLNLGFYSFKKKAIVKNVGGPFMLDKGSKHFVKGIRDYETEIWRLYGYTGNPPRISENFQFAALVAAHELKSKMRKGRGLDDAVWGYNGRIRGTTVKQNAYTWNNPLKGHRMIFRHRDKQGHLLEFIDERPGVMVIYGEILKLRKAGAL